MFARVDHARDRPRGSTPTTTSSPATSRISGGQPVHTGVRSPARSSWSRRSNAPAKGAPHTPGSWPRPNRSTAPSGPFHRTSTRCWTRCRIRPKMSPTDHNPFGGWVVSSAVRGRRWNITGNSVYKIGDGKVVVESLKQ